MITNKFTHRLTKLLIDIMFYGGILSCVAVPFITPPLTRWLGHPEDMIVRYIVILVLSGLCAIYILFQLKAIFKTLVGGNPFVHQNVSSLRKCAVASLLIALVYFVRIIFWFTIGSAIIVIIFALLGLFALTLKDVFKQAIAYKEESDWTV